MNHHIDTYGNVWTAGTAASLPEEGKVMNLDEAKRISDDWQSSHSENREALEWAVAEIKRLNIILYGIANTALSDALRAADKLLHDAGFAEIGEIRNSAMLSEAEASAALAAAGDADGTGSQQEKEE